MEKEIGLELKENEIVDNPFDVMMHFSMELVRELLFASHRFKNNEIPEMIRTNEDKLDFYINQIKEEFLKLDAMSDETVAMCRETSYYYPQNRFETMNQTLLKMERDMETVYSRCVPNRNDRFERIRLGKDSKEYKRLLELRAIVDKSEELSNANKNDFNSLCDVLSRPEECVPFWMTQDEFDKKKSIIETYHLTEDDVEYMMAYKFGNH